MDDESGKPTEPMEEVPLIGLDESELERCAQSSECLDEEEVSSRHEQDSP